MERDVPSAHCVAIGLVTLARDMLGTWEISEFKVIPTTGSETPLMWLEHPWNIEYGPWSGPGGAQTQLCPSGMTLPVR